MDSKIKCSKCLSLKSQTEFPDYYRNFIWLYHNSKLKDYGIALVCQTCFEKIDEKELLHNEFYQSPDSFGYEQCEKCENWITDSEFFFDYKIEYFEDYDCDYDFYPVCQNCFDDSDGRELGFMYCSECDEWKEYSEFFKDSIAGHNIKSVCIDCLKEKSDLHKCRKCGNWKKQSEFYSESTDDKLFDVCSDCFDNDKDWWIYFKKQRGRYFYLKAFLIVVGAITIIQFLDTAFESFFDLPWYIVIYTPLPIVLIFMFIGWLRDRYF